MNNTAEKPSLNKTHKEKIKILTQEISYIQISSCTLKVLFTLLLITYVTMISVIPFMIPLYSTLLTLITILFLFSEAFYYQKKEKINEERESLLRNSYHEKEAFKEKDFTKGVFYFENLIYILGFFPLFLALLNLLTKGLF